MERADSNNPVRAVGAMMILSLLGKVLGLVRDRLLTVNYGTGMAANAFLTASRIPRVFFDAIFAAAIAASFIPVYNEYLVAKGRDKADAFAGNFITVIGLLSGLLTGLGMLFAPQLTAFFADGFDAETAALCTELTRVLFPSVLCTAVAYAFVGILQSLDEFKIPALISVVANGLVIVYYFTLNGRFGIRGLAVAFLIAWAAQTAVQFPSLIRKKYRFRPSANFRSEGMRKVFRLMLPVMVSTWVVPINQTVNAKFGSRLFGGAGVSAIELSYNLYTIIVGIFILSVTNYIFPRLSRSSAGDDWEGLRSTIRGTMHASLYIVLPMTVGLMVLARPVVDLIYGGGAFDGFSVDITARALVFLCLGMVGYAAQTVLSRAFFAQQKGAAPLVAGGAAIAVNVLLCVLLTDVLDVAGLAIASAAACTVNGVILLLPLQRRGLGFLDAAFLADLGKMTAASLAMGGAAWGLYRLLDGSVAGTGGKLLTVGVPALAGVLLYFALTLLLRVGEARTAAGFAGRLLKKR